VTTDDGLMSGFWRDLSPKGWEKFCEIMIRHHHGVNHFQIVPDEDSGDCGIEFFTADGCIFQCYFPDQDADMATYKKNARNKIREDLRKLKKYESKISSMLGGIVVSRWILLMPTLRSKDLIAHCHTCKKKTLKEDIGFIDEEAFTVKIETAESYPDAFRYARRMHTQEIDIPIESISASQQDIWAGENSGFMGNIERKSELLMREKAPAFQDRVVTKYIQNEHFLEQLRDGYPDLHELVEGSGGALLEEMKDSSVLEGEIDYNFIKEVLKANKKGFDKYYSDFSDANAKSLPFGYLAKWIAECNMDFET
jgi:hypothetical protein